MNRTKILFLTTTGKINGAEKQLQHLLNNLNSNRFSAAICTLKKEGDLLNSIQNKKVRTYSLNIKSKLEFWKASQLSKVIRDENPNIIHSFLFFDNLLARILGRFHGKIIINSQRNCNTSRPPIRHFLDKTTQSLVDWYISNSYSGKKLLITQKLFKSPERIFVLPNAIDLKKYKVNKKTEYRSEFKVVTIGRLVAQKNFLTLIRALKYIENTSLTVLGEGPLKKRLSKEANRLRVLVNFEGYVENVTDYLASSDLFVLPSLWEGLPNSIMEAMALKKAVIAADVGDVERLIDSMNGFLLKDPLDHKELHDKIVLLKHNKTMRLRLEENAYKKISKYSTKNIIQRYMEILDDVKSQSSINHRKRLQNYRN